MNISFNLSHSHKNHQALWWNWLMRTATGNEDPELPLLQRISSLELPASENAAQISASQSSSNRHISTSTVQRRLCESNFCKETTKDTIKKKRLAWAKKHGQWTLDSWKSVVGSDESKFEIFCSNRRVFVRCRVVNGWSPHVWFPQRRIEVVVWWCGGALLVTLSVIYLEFKEHLTSIDTTHSAAIPSGLCLLLLFYLTFI